MHARMLCNLPYKVQFDLGLHYWLRYDNQYIWCNGMQSTALLNV